MNTPYQEPELEEACESSVGRFIKIHSQNLINVGRIVFVAYSVKV